jgi:hypothetical protein
MNSYLVQGLTALIPMAVGFLWYNPKTFQNAWMGTINMTEAKMAKGNMGLIFGLSFLMALLLTMPLSYFANHPTPAYGGDASYDTFQHGVAHGVLLTLFFALPVIATKALFEQRNFKYVLINTGYWLVTLSLMCGVLDYFLPTVGS